MHIFNNTNLYHVLDFCSWNDYFLCEKWNGCFSFVKSPKSNGLYIPYIPGSFIPGIKWWWKWYLPPQNSGKNFHFKLTLFLRHNSYFWCLCGKLSWSILMLKMIYKAENKFWKHVLRLPLKCGIGTQDLWEQRKDQIFTVVPSKIKISLEISAPLSARLKS